MHPYFIRVGETACGNVNMIFHWITGGKSGPTLGLMAGVHGSEVSSIGGLIQFLHEIEAYNNQGRMTGRILALPFANPQGLGRMERGIDGKDLNRSFPGDRDAGIEERIAHTIFRTFLEAKVDLLVDLHTMGPLSLPFTIVDRMPDAKMQQKVFEYASLFGLGVVHDLPHTLSEKERLDKSSTGQFVRSGIPAFTAEVPGVRYSPSPGEEVMRAGLWNLVRALKMVPQEDYLFWQHPTRAIIGVGMHSRFPGPRAAHAGFFQAALPSGATVQRGDAIGKIWSMMLQHVENVQVLRDGYLLDLPDRSMVATGDELGEMLVREK